MMKKDHILNEIKRTAKNNAGKPLGMRKFEEETRITQFDWEKYWTKWSEAVKEAGFKPNLFLTPAYDENWLIKKLIDYTQELGHFPTESEMKFKHHNDKYFPVLKTFYRLGSKNERVLKVVEFCEKNEGFSDVLGIVRPLCDTEEKDINKEMDESEEKYGFVYLMKSGKYHKIGRSDHVGRRNYDLGIKLPQKLEVIYEIKTDDPIGVEAYWHKRFESKRTETEGEWFHLNSNDVKKFKKWKRIF